MSDFPKAPPQSLTREHVVEYLKEWVTLGWQVVEEADGSFSIILGPVQKIGIKNESGKWVLSQGPGTRRLVKQPEHSLELRVLVEAMARQQGVAPQSPPSQIRLIQGLPVGNTGRLVALINTSIVQAVYDVYLDDKAILNLGVLHNLGVHFASSLRLLSSDKKAPKSLTKHFVNDFFQEAKCANGEGRFIAYAGHEHRLLFLAGGDIITLGGSLNNLDINERMHRGPDQGDMQTFENTWKIAKPL